MPKTSITITAEDAAAAALALDFMAAHSELADRQPLPFADKSSAPLHAAANRLRVSA